MTVPIPADHLDSQKFKFVCDACGSMTIKIPEEHASETTIVECGRCHSRRGTMAALRDLAKQEHRDWFEFEARV
jgi:DNA-directed RNA polymerase subunit RPC12/RpoP